MRTVSSNHAASGCYPEVFLSLLRQMVTMDTLAALGCSSCATGAGPASRVEAPARLVCNQVNADTQYMLRRNAAGPPEDMMHTVFY